MKNIIQLLNHLCINKNFDTIECCDVDINYAEFETTWIEIKNNAVVYLDIHH